jgi:transforming growth factor-beta-induced protein
MKKLVLSTVLLLAVLISACAPQAAQTPVATELPKPTEAPKPTATPEPMPEPKDIVDTAVADGRFTTLATALTAAGLVDTLKGEGPFTVFAPTDEAFAKLPAGTLEALLKDIPQLKNILLYHVVAGKVMASDVVKLDGKMADTALEGKQIGIKVDGDKVMLNDNVMVVITDVEAANGVIHVIDAVLLPPADEMAAEAKKDIVDTAVADGRFTTLVAAVQAAGLVDTLKGEGPFTLFAPTDEAFAKLPAGTVEDLLKPENLETLTNILLYHVVPGKVMAADVVKLDGKMVDTALEGKQIKITVKDGKVYLNDTVQVIITDIETSNGVIHVIDAVLLPPA